MTRAPEPKDKLDAAMTVAVNGPEGEILDWHAVDWRSCEESVRRLRQQIPRCLLEPDARKRARPVLRGGRAQQCVRPTRPEQPCRCL
jgi:hypothetical protein